MIPKSEIDKKLLPSKNDHTFWLKLGRETCNLSEWSFYCFLIIQENYGKSDPRAKSLWALHDNTFINIKGVLDDFLLRSYEKGSKEEHELLAALHEYAQPPRVRLPPHDRLYITDVFYNIDNIEKPILRRRQEGSKYPKFLDAEEIEYIQEFRQRMHEYIQYLKYLKFIDYPANFGQRFDKAVKKIDSAHANLLKKFVTV
jgi:hypothetical protein